MKTACPIVLTCMATLAVTATGSAQSLRAWHRLAATMVDREIAAARVTDQRVLQAVRETPRHEFVPANQRQYAYFDMALPIGAGQTISPPFVVAYMTQEIDPQPSDRILEIGTGSGYQAAVLSPLVHEVYTIEIVEELARKASRTLQRLGYKNVFTRTGDGYVGWQDAAPFNKIIVTCSPEKVPQPLVDQLAEGGRMIVPVGERYQQNLYLFRKEAGKLISESLRATLFVPMTGRAEARREILPDPLRPQIANGSFEDTLDGQPAGWHYQRQLELIDDAQAAPDGDRYVHFHNRVPGRGAHALQGFAVDGRKVSALQLSFSVRGDSIHVGQTRDQWPMVIVTFYDDRRAIVGHKRLGPYRGTFDWQREEGKIKVPLRAREAILRIGLLGAIGHIYFDHFQMLDEQI